MASETMTTALPQASSDDYLPSLPNVDDLLTSYGPRAERSAKALAPGTSDEVGVDHVYEKNTKRVRRQSTATITSIGRPRHLATPTKFKVHHDSREATTFVPHTSTKELSSFLWTNNPSPGSWTSSDDSVKQKKTWFGWLTRAKTHSPDALQLPDCAVATRAPSGQWHLAIHIPQPMPSQGLVIDPRVKDSDSASIFSKTTMTRKMNQRLRRQSIDSVSTTMGRNRPGKSNPAPPGSSRQSTEKKSTDMLRRLFAGSDMPEASISTEGLASVPTQESNTSSIRDRRCVSVNISDIPTPTIAARSGVVASRDVSNQHQDPTPHIAHRQVLTRVRPEGAHIRRSTSMPFKQKHEQNEETEPFPDYSYITRQSQESVRSSTPSVALGTARPFQVSSVGNLVHSDVFSNAKLEVRRTLEQAQHEENDAKAVVHQAEQDARDTIPALEKSTELARRILQEAKATASQAMEDGDVDAAMGAAKRAAEAQSAIMTADRQISATKIQLEMLLSAANARLTEAQSAAKAARQELQMIALAEVKAEQDRLEAEAKERERIAAERKASEEKKAKERAAELAAAEARALAEVRETFARIEQEETARIAAEAAAAAEADRQRFMMLRSQTAPEIASLPTMPLAAPSATQDPEVREMASRLRKMEETNQMMMQTLSAVVKMGAGFEELTKALADKEMTRSDSGVILV